MGGNTTEHTPQSRAHVLQFSPKPKAQISSPQEETVGGITQLLQVPSPHTGSGRGGGVGGVGQTPQSDGQLKQFSPTSQDAGFLQVGGGGGGGGGREGFTQEADS